MAIGIWDMCASARLNMVSSDEVEGLRLRLDVKTGDLISKRIALGGYLAYGIKIMHLNTVAILVWY
ncbi:MAG: hypothetical protein IPI65_16505 [Bacteroidetes bacterium]|nr:hypothetical protein [Bacteroidota bacterium]